MFKNYILVFDFDGVILDSAKENYYTGLKAYKKFKRKAVKTKFFTLKKFLEGRPLCRSGDEFYIIFKLMEENPEINFKKISFKKWKRLLNKYNDKAKKYTDIFYQVRKESIKKNFKKWLRYQSLYKGISNEIKKAKKIFKKVLIATAKDAKSAEKILNYYNLNLKVIGREFSTHKDRQLTYIKEKYKVNYKNLIFIDDFVENLIVPKKLGITVALAKWGYINPESLKLAKKYKIPILRLSNLNKQIQHLTRSQAGV